MSCKKVIPGTFIACGEGGNYCSVECQFAALIAGVRAAPAMTPRERSLQRLDWDYGNLACSTKHKPSRAAFEKWAREQGWTQEEFDAWSAGKEWWA